MRILSRSGRHDDGPIIYRIFDPLFITYCFGWFIIHLFRRMGHPIPYLNNWLTDFLFIPIVAHLSLALTRYKQPYPLSWLVSMGIYTAIIFEYIYPAFTKKTTADPVDAVAYIAGSIFFYYCHQRFGRIFK